MITFITLSRDRDCCVMDPAKKSWRHPSRYVNDVVCTNGESCVRRLSLLSSHTILLQFISYNLYSFLDQFQRLMSILPSFHWVHSWTKSCSIRARTLWEMDSRALVLSIGCIRAWMEGPYGYWFIIVRECDCGRKRNESGSRIRRNHFVVAAVVKVAILYILLIFS